MRNIFKDTELQARIDKDGFVVIPLFSPEEIDALKAIYQSLKTDMGNDFYLSIWSADEKYKGETHKRIVDVIKDKAEALFDDYKPVVSNFAVKKPGQKSDFDLHQGINFTDESKYISITMWIPLQDVFFENGNMQVVRGSHTFFDQDIRSQHYPTPFSEIKTYINENYVENLPMKVGEVWIFNHRLLHRSPVNSTDKERIATLNVFIPREAPVLLYYKSVDDAQKKGVEILEFTEDNYYLQNVNDKPNVSGLVSVGNTEEKHYKVSGPEFDELYMNYNGKRLAPIQQPDAPRAKGLKSWKKLFFK